MLPGIAVVSGAFMLQWTILFNRVHHGLVWKSSNLASLFHPINDSGSLPAKFQYLDKLSEMDDEAKKVYGRFERDDYSSLRLVMSRIIHLQLALMPSSVNFLAHY